MCCAADWKREVVQDYKWDYVDVTQFRKTNLSTRLRYSLIYICLFRDLAIIGLDVFTCVTMIISDGWKSAVFKRCQGVGNDTCSWVKFDIARWVFVGCIFFSFLLYAYEFYKARQVVLSRDISYAYTNVMANDYFSMKDYNKFCLFCRLGASKKKKDTISFFVFFSFKNWKRVLLADGPRQCINGILLFLVAKSLGFTTEWDKLSQYWDDSTVTLLLLLAMLTTIALFLISFLQLVIASVLYIPLLFYIQGNLKEYVCHKVDKRMGHIMKTMQKQRFNRAIEFEKKLAHGETITNSKGEVVDASFLQPTLPVITLDDDKDAARDPYKRPLTPPTRAMTPTGRPMSPANAMSPANGRPMTPANGRPMHPPAFRSMSPAPQWDAQPAFPPQMPTPASAPAPSSMSCAPDNDMTSLEAEMTEMDILDAYSDDQNSWDDHSSHHGHGGGYYTGSNHGHGQAHSSNHGHGFAHGLRSHRGHDASQVSLLGSAAPMGYSTPAPPRPAFPEPSLAAPAHRAPPRRAYPDIMYSDVSSERAIPYDARSAHSGQLPYTPPPVSRPPMPQDHGW